MSTADSKLAALETPPEPAKSSLRDAYIAEVLGDVGKVLDGVSALQMALPELERRLELILSKTAQSLSAAESDAKMRVRAAGEAAGTEAVQRVVGEQVKMLLGQMALASEDLCATAEKASSSLRRAVEKVSIWRLIGFCAGSGAVSALLVSLLIWFFGASVTVEGCPATLSKEQCNVYLFGGRMKEIWSHLPEETRASIKSVNQAVN